jgi:hypothetical protein
VEFYLGCKEVIVSGEPIVRSQISNRRENGIDSLVEFIISNGTKRSLHPRTPVPTTEPIVIARIQDKLKETGGNKELLELTNNDRFARHLMMRAM